MMFHSKSTDSVASLVSGNLEKAKVPKFIDFIPSNSDAVSLSRGYHLKITSNFRTLTSLLFEVDESPSFQSFSAS